MPLGPETQITSNISNQSLKNPGLFMQAVAVLDASHWQAHHTYLANSQWKDLRHEHGRVPVTVPGSIHVVPISLGAK